MPYSKYNWKFQNLNAKTQATLLGKVIEVVPYLAFLEEIKGTSYMILPQEELKKYIEENQFLFFTPDFGIILSSSNKIKAFVHVTHSTNKNTSHNKAHITLTELFECELYSTHVGLNICNFLLTFGEGWWPFYIDSIFPTIFGVKDHFHFPGDVWNKIGDLAVQAAKGGKEKWGQHTKMNSELVKRFKAHLFNSLEYDKELSEFWSNLRGSLKILLGRLPATDLVHKDIIQEEYNRISKSKESLTPIYPGHNLSLRLIHFLLPLYYAQSYEGKNVEVQIIREFGSLIEGKNPEVEYDMIVESVSSSQGIPREIIEAAIKSLTYTEFLKVESKFDLISGTKKAIIEAGEKFLSYYDLVPYFSKIDVGLSVIDRTTSTKLIASELRYPFLYEILLRLLFCSKSPLQTNVDPYSVLNTMSKEELSSLLEELRSTQVTSDFIRECLENPLYIEPILMKYEISNGVKTFSDISSLIQEVINGMKSNPWYNFVLSYMYNYTSNELFASSSNIKRNVDSLHPIIKKNSEGFDFQSYLSMWKKYLGKRLAGALRDTKEDEGLETHHPLVIITEEILNEIINEINGKSETPKLKYLGLSRVENLIYDINMKNSDKSLFLRVNVVDEKGPKKSIFVRPKGWQDHNEDYLSGVIRSLRLKFADGKITLRDSIASSDEYPGVALISDFGITKTGWNETVKKRIENAGCKVVIIHDLLQDRSEFKDWLESLS